VNIVFPRLRFTRTGIFILLAVLVALLGAAAKHSQFDSPPHHGYLSKAVKMVGVRATSSSDAQAAQVMATPDTLIAIDVSAQPVALAPPFSPHPSISLFSPPLRV